GRHDPVSPTFPLAAGYLRAPGRRWRAARSETAGAGTDPRGADNLPAAAGPPGRARVSGDAAAHTRRSGIQAFRRSGRGWGEGPIPERPNARTPERPPRLSQRPALRGPRASGAPGLSGNPRECPSGRGAVRPTGRAAAGDRAGGGAG